MTPATQTLPWLTLAELAERRLPGLPTREDSLRRHAGAQGWTDPAREAVEGRPTGTWRRRAGDGGAIEYSPLVLPVAARLVLGVVPIGTDPVSEAAARKEKWRWFDRLADKAKERAKARLAAVQGLRALTDAGMAREAAVATAAAAAGVSTASLYGWDARVIGVPRGDWLPALADHYAGRIAEAEIDPEAWELFKADFLRACRPTAAECYARLGDVARARGWTLPSQKTLMRKVEREVDPRVVILLREGRDALEETKPAQRRTRAEFRPLEAINYDGHKLDLWVDWGDGQPNGRAFLLTFQDLGYSNILSWRLDRSENAAAFRLTFGDLCAQWGIPDHVYSDNTMAAACKEMSAGSRFRFRFKIKDEDPLGLFAALGSELHFVKPAHGQSKPIERAFGDLARYISKAPECEGAYLGNTPLDKPHNYGQRSIALKELVAVCEREIVRFNTRVDRTGMTAREGQSFQAAFEVAYQTTPIRRATSEQARLWQLKLEGVKVRKDGTIHLYGNRYGSDAIVMAGLLGKPVGVRFDPDALHAPIEVYRLDGSWVCTAACIEDTGFADADAAKVSARARATRRRAVREIAEAEVRLTAADVAAAQPVPEVAPTVEARVIRLPVPVGPPSTPADIDSGDAPRGPAPVFDFSAFARGMQALAGTPKTNNAADHPLEERSRGVA